MESRQIAQGRACLKLPEDVQDLLLRVPFALHMPPNLLLDLQSDWHRKQGQGQRGVSLCRNSYQSLSALDSEVSAHFA